MGGRWWLQRTGTREAKWQSANRVNDVFAATCGAGNSHVSRCRSRVLHPIARKGVKCAITRIVRLCRGPKACCRRVKQQCALSFSSFLPCQYARTAVSIRTRATLAREFFFPSVTSARNLSLLSMLFFWAAKKLWNVRARKIYIYKPFDGIGLCARAARGLLLGFFFSFFVWNGGVIDRRWNGVIDKGDGDRFVMEK